MNSKKLKGKIREEGKIYQECADALKISLTNFNNKVNGKSAFKILEAQTLGDFLNMTNDEKINIFLK
ncbi:hypothetical protein [Methanobrevibacter sp.]|uniref:hypothetical protein n=1 Tax=Methanobrevibacter sp. TaxID=66852 RepID=UPI00388F3EF8